MRNEKENPEIELKFDSNITTGHKETATGSSEGFVPVAARIALL